ncbi:MAG: hypothetical protein CL760_01390 [Chloroflexi bacterium]|nr:hypothetical protein [Chloroflexota bacterium]
MDLYEKFITINKKKKNLESKIEESLEKKYKSKHPFLYYINKLFNIERISGLFNMLVLSIMSFIFMLEKVSLNSEIKIIPMMFGAAIFIGFTFILYVAISLTLSNACNNKKSRLRKKERTMFKLDLNKINKELSDLTETEENKYEIAKKIYIKESEKSELTKEEKTFLKSYRLKVYDDYLKDESVEIINE